MLLCTVEKLLSMCSSSCLPGGGSNTELALHCLHFCQGNTMVHVTISGSIFSLTLHLFFLVNHTFTEITTEPIPLITYFLSFFLLKYPFKFLQPLAACSPSCPFSSLVQATLEKLLFSLPLPTGDYHYSGKPLTFDLTSPWQLGILYIFRDHF